VVGRRVEHDVFYLFAVVTLPVVVVLTLLFVVVVKQWRAGVFFALFFTVAVTIAIAVTVAVVDVFISIVLVFGFITWTVCEWRVVRVIWILRFLLLLRRLVASQNALNVQH